jgi:hypothetical protein
MAAAKPLLLILAPDRLLANQAPRMVEIRVTARSAEVELLAGCRLSWAGRFFPVVPLIVAAIAYAAEPLPTKFIGSWCLDS